MIIKKIKNRKKSVKKTVRIRRLAAYIMAPETENSSEKCIHFGARGFLASTVQGQVGEMVSLARDALRSSDPVLHVVLSWQKGEQPSPKQADEAADLLLDELKLRGHQLLYALHADTDNWHLHVIINRVDPDSLRVVKINNGFDIKALHRACARIEYTQGWRPQENAHYRVDENGKVVPTSRTPKEHGVEPTQQQIDKELLKGEMSSARYAIEFGGPILARVRSWPQVHEWLSQYNMRYLRAGSGAVVQVGDVRVKASTVSRNATLRELEERLGPYVPPDEPEPGNESARSEEGKHKKSDSQPVPNPKAAWPYIREARTWKELHRALAEHDMRYEKTGSGATIFAGTNDEISMKASQVSRKAALRQLEARLGPYLPPPGYELARPGLDSIHNDFPRWKEYVHMTCDDADKEQIARDRLDAELLQQADEEERQRTRHQEERAELSRQQSWEGQLAALHLLRSLLAAQHAKEKEELKERHRIRRLALVDEFPRCREYGDWIEHPELALLWDRRLSRPAGIEPSARARLEDVGRITHDIRDYHGRLVGDWVVYATNEQRARGGIGFVDRNVCIDVHDSKNEASILAALQLASEKWGRIAVRGDRAYLETCARLAAVHDFKIKNPELQQAIVKYRKIISEKQRERRAKRNAPTSKSRSTASRPLTTGSRSPSKGGRGGYDPW